MNCLLCSERERNDGAAYYNICEPEGKRSFLHPRERIEMICAFIDRTYTEDLSRSYLSGLFGINSDTLSRHFNQYKGKGLCEYIKERRINHAVRLLSETDLSVTKISIECGFDNIRTFNRAFRRFTSMSPGEYRRNACRFSPPADSSVND